MRGADAVRGVLDRSAALGRDAEAASRLEEDVRSRLTARDLLGRTPDLEELREPGASRTASMTVRFEDDASASR